MVSTRTSQVAITLCLVFLALFVARVRGQTQSLVIDSATYISGLDLIFNQTSGQFEYQQGVNTGYLRVRGPPGSSINLKIMSPGSNGTFYQSTEVTIELNSVIYTYTIQNISFQPDTGGLWAYEVFLDLVDNDLDEMQHAEQALASESVLTGTGLPSPTVFDDPGTSRRKRSLDDEYTDGQDWFTTDGRPLSDTFRAQKPVAPTARGKKGGSKRSNTFMHGNVHVEVTGTLTRILAARKAMVDAVNAKQQTEAGKRKRSLDFLEEHMETHANEVEMLQEQLYHHILAKVWGIPESDMHKIMPDDHYLYQERPGIWVAASELTPTERFRLRLAGKTFHVQTEVQNDDKLTEISQLLSQYQDMREYLEVLNYAKDVVESALPGNVTGRQAMHLVRAPFVASGPETHEAYLNHRRRKRDNTYGDQSTAQALFYQDFGSACGANDQETTIFNIVPCLIVSVSQVNYGLSIQQNEFNKLLTLFGLQVDINGNLIAAANGLFTVVQSLQAELNVVQSQLQTVESQIQSIQAVVNTENYNDQLLGLQVSAVGAQVIATGQVTAQTQTNIINAINGNVDAQTQATIQMQQQILDVGQLAGAMVDQASSIILAAMAQGLAGAATNVDDLRTLIYFTQTQQANQMNTWMNQKDADFQKLYEMVSATVGVTRSNSKALVDLYNNLFVPGNLSAAYYSTEGLLNVFRGGNLMMLVDPSTRIPPRNMSVFTVISSMDVVFNYTNPNAPGVAANTTAAAQIKAMTDAVVMEHSLMKIQFPDPLDPDSIIYTTTVAGINNVSFFAPGIILYQISWQVQDVNGTTEDMLLQVNSGVLGLVNDTDANRASAQTCRFFIASDINGTTAGSSVKDGNIINLYCIQGIHVYLIDWSLEANTTKTFGVGISPLPDVGATNSTPVVVKLLNSTLEGMILTYLANTTIKQGQGAYLVPMEEPITSTGSVTQGWFYQDIRPLAILDLNPEDPSNPLTVLSFTFYRTNPSFAPGGTSLSFETPQQANQTADGAWTAFEDSAITSKRRKRSFPDGTAFNECYQGINIINNVYDQYSQMPGSSRTRMNSCISNPQCMYTKIRAPQTVMLYSDPYFGGTATPYDVSQTTNNNVNAPTQYMHCDFSGTNQAGTFNGGNILGAWTRMGLAGRTHFLSAVIPPSVNAQFFTEWLCRNAQLQNLGKAAGCNLGAFYPVTGQQIATSVSSCLQFEQFSPPFTYGFTTGQACTANNTYSFGGSTGPWGFGTSPQTCNGGSEAGNMFGLCSCALQSGPPLWFYSTPNQQNADWEFCYPADPWTYDNTPNGQWQDSFAVEYFKTAGDTGMGGANPIYSPGTVQVRMTWPSCTVLTVTQCNQLGRQGMCQTYIDPNNTIVFPSTADVHSRCDSVANNPCNGTTSADACIAITDAPTGVPLCMWSVKTSVCMPMDPFQIGTLNVAPNSPTSAVAQEYQIPCGYRDATVGENCAFDAQCYVYQSPFFLTDSASYPRLCLPIGSPGIYVSFLEEPTIPFVALGSLDAGSVTTFLTSELGIDLQACGQQNAQCAFRLNTATLMVNWLIGLSKGFTTLQDYLGQCAGTSPTLQPMFTTGTSSICSSSYLMYDPTWTGAWDSPDHKALGLLSACQVYSNQCITKCELYGNDLDSCELAGGQTFCFINAYDLTCHTATLANLQTYCPLGGSNTFGVTSPCLQSSNICSTFRANVTVSGTPVTLSQFTQNLTTVGANPNLAVLRTTECAALGGYNGFGNLSLASGDPRFANRTLPRILNGLCTAVISSTGQLSCQQATMVAGGCGLGEACDLYSNTQDAIARQANLLYCRFPTPAVCMTSSDDPNAEVQPCGWLYEDGNFAGGQCKQLAKCQANSVEGSTLNCATIRNFAGLVATTFTTRVGTPNQFLAMGFDPATAVQSSLALYTTQPIIVGALQSTCPDGAVVHGFVCCSDSTCSAAFLNPWDPVIAYQTAFQTVAAQNAPLGTPSPTVQVTTTIIFAGKLMTSPVDNTTQFYSVEPFVSDQGALLWNFRNPGEVPKQKVVTNRDGSNWAMMTPLMIHSANGSLFGDYRATVTAFNYTLYNTMYGFNLVTGLSTTTLANSVTPLLNDTRITRVQMAAPNNNNGVYFLVTDPSQALPSAITTLIQLRVNVLTSIYGNYTPNWGSSPPFGATTYNIPAGVDPDGNPTSGGKGLIVAYCNRNFYIPIHMVMDERPPRFTSTLTMSGYAPKTPDVATHWSPYASMLPNLGYKYVQYTNTTTGILYSVDDEYIGINEPGKIGFITSQTATTDYNFVANNVPRANPFLDARNFYRWLDQFSATATPNAQRGSCEEVCGSLLSNTQSAPGADTQILQLSLSLNLTGIGPNNTFDWETRLNNTSPAFILYFTQLVPQVGFTIGCKGYISNTVDPGFTSDNYGLWYEVACNDTAQTCDPAALAAVMTAQIVTPQNRAMCGNCFLTSAQPTQDMIDANPTVNFCNWTFGSSIIYSAPSTANLQDIPAAANAFCLKCSYWNFTNAPEESALYVEALNTNGYIDATFSLPLNIQLITEYQASTLCVTVLSTQNETTIHPGHYLMLIDNSIPPVLEFTISVRVDPTTFGTPATALGPCDQDYFESIASNTTNVPYEISICPDVLSYIQVFNPNATACSIIFVATNSYSVGQLNSLQDVQTKINQFNSLSLVVANDQALALSALQQALAANITATNNQIVSVQNALFLLDQQTGVNYAATLASITNITSIMNSGFASTLSNTASQFAHVNLTTTQLNGTILDLSARTAAIEANSANINNQIRIITQQMDIFTNETNLFDAIANQVYAQFANISDFINNATAENALLQQLLSELGTNSQNNADSVAAMLKAALSLSVISTFFALVNLVLGIVVAVRVFGPEMNELINEIKLEQERKKAGVAEQQQQQQDGSFEQQQQQQPQPPPGSTAGRDGYSYSYSSSSSQPPSYHSTPNHSHELPAYSPPPQSAWSGRAVASSNSGNPNDFF